MISEWQGGLFQIPGLWAPSAEAQLRLGGKVGLRLDGQWQKGCLLLLFPSLTLQHTERKGKFWVL